jgi:glycine/D-amino acid oxidase-like deaminating enzyme
MDMVVIGGGVIGLCLSWFLAQAGVKVLCLDSGHHGGSNANAGSLHVQMQSRFMRLYPGLVAGLERALPMYVAAVRQWQLVAAELDADIELKLTGGLMVAETADQFAFLETKCRREAELGLPVQMLDRAALDRLAPYLGPAVLGAELCEIEGKLNPLLANAAIRRQVMRCGAVVQEATTVTGLAHDGQDFTIAAHNTKIVARRLVIAAGSGSRDLAAMLGVAIPVQAEPLHMNITERTTPMLGHLVQHAERSITLKQLNAGHIVIGGGWPARLQGPRSHPTVELSSLIGNVSLAQHVVPRIGALRILRTWAGINTTGDGRSILGAVPTVPGLFVAIPGDAGYTLGPLCARLVADAMLGGTTDIAINEYSPIRFA